MPVKYGQKAKRLLWLAVLFACGCAARPPAPRPAPIGPGPLPKKDWTITAAWKFDFTNFVACNAPAVAVGCVSGFTWGYMQNGIAVPLKTSPASACTGTAQPEACKDSTNAMLGIGPVVPYIVTNAVDNTGAAIVSTPVTGLTDTVALPAATSFAWTRQ